MGFLKTSVRAIPLSTFDVSGLSGTYQSVNGTGFEFPVFYLRFENASDANVTISYDGITDNEFLAGTASSIPRQTLEINLLASSPLVGHIAFPKNTTIWVKGSAGTGNFYVSGYYLPAGGS